MQLITSAAQYRIVSHFQDGRGRGGDCMPAAPLGPTAKRFLNLFRPESVKSLMTGDEKWAQYDDTKRKIAEYSKTKAFFLLFNRKDSTFQDYDYFFLVIN